jgi:DNA-binding beta-propeller fold protein YncE
MAFDGDHNHLFVAEYGNGSIDDINLSSGTARRITGLHEPQGVTWLPKQGEIAVASGDGALTFYRGSDHKEIARINLGEDADNVRIDGRNGNLVVGFGSGGLAVVDPVTHRVVRKLRLGAHPEAFVLVGSRVFVNIPGAHKIAVADLDKAQVITTMSTGHFAENYAMAADATGSNIADAYRSPGALSVIDPASGATVFSVPICGDADDLYFHGERILAVCGEGVVELIAKSGQHTSIRVRTAGGSRTGLLAPNNDSLFVAVPGRGSGATIWQLAFR